MLNADGTRATSLAEMKEHVKIHFETLYGCDEPVNFSTKVLSGLNSWLRVFPHEEEVKYSLFTMRKMKQPGPDRVTTEILQYHWSMVGPSIMAPILYFSDRKHLIKSLNFMHLTMIPKKVGSTSLSDFWPIACMNVIYRMLAKLHAKWLSTILSSTISLITFIKGRRINDKVSLRQEFRQRFNHKSGSQRACISIDFSKAFDKIRWDVLDVTIQAMGFDQLFRKMVNVCISSTSLHPCRGLTDGDIQSTMRDQTGGSDVTYPVHAGIGNLKQEA